LRAQRHLRRARRRGRGGGYGGARPRRSPAREVRRRLDAGAASQRRELPAGDAQMNNVVLVGFMGSGKSTVGPCLAQRMDRPFVDLDDVIEAEAGRTVAEIFS